MSHEVLKTILITVLTSSGIIGILTAFIISKLKKLVSDSNARNLGIQALLRHNLYDLHHRYCEERGYAPLPVKEDFENMYKQYHALGANGVMDGIKDEFHALPTTKPLSDEH